MDSGLFGLVDLSKGFVLYSESYFLVLLLMKRCKTFDLLDFDISLKQ